MTLIYREGNSVADFLAKKALELDRGVFALWRTPPPGAELLLDQDRLGLRWPRIIPCNARVRAFRVSPLHPDKK